MREIGPQSTTDELRFAEPLLEGAAQELGLKLRCELHGEKSREPVWRTNIQARSCVPFREALPATQLRDIPPGPR